MYREQIHEYVQCHKTEIIQTLKDLIAIPSVRGEASEGAPFGPGPAAILKYAEQLYGEHGFDTEMAVDGSYLLAYSGEETEGQKSIGVFAHADTVAPGDGWIYTDPFVPLEKEGYIIGRGAVDNKSAMIISLYCAKLFRELGIPFDSRLVMFTGGNEETGMQDIRNYVSRHVAPDLSLVCDTAFPLYRGDKGRMTLKAISNTPLEEVKDFCGGESLNIILGKAQVRLNYREELYAALKEMETERIKVTAEDNQEILIETEGISRHGALPEGSLNAGYLAAEMLASCEQLGESDRKQFSYVAEVLKRYYGEVFEIENEDSEFGKLTCINGVIRLEDGKISFTLDLRFGATAELETLKEKISNHMQKHGWSMQPLEETTSWVIPKDNAIVDALLGVYRDFTGNSTAETYVNAGMTYAGKLPFALETGVMFYKHMPFPIPAGHGGAHQPDECISIEGLLEAIEVIALMLLKADEKLNQ